jgi:hypothetical protein
MRDEPVIEADKGPAFTSPHDDAANRAHLGENFEELQCVNKGIPYGQSGDTYAGDCSIWRVVAGEIQKRYPHEEAR